MTADGVCRSYRLFAPLSLDRTRPAPPVLVLAGVGNTGGSMVEATGFDRVAERDGFLAAYREGLNQTRNAGYCCLGRATSCPDDVAFLTRVIGDVGAKSRIDPTRVYAIVSAPGG